MAKPPPDDAAAKAAQLKAEQDAIAKRQAEIEAQAAREAIEFERLKAERLRNQQ